MEVNVKVTHELGEETKKFIAGLITGKISSEAAPKAAAKIPTPSKEKEEDEVVEEKTPTRSRRGAAAPAKEVEETEAPTRKARTPKVEDEAPATKRRARGGAAKEETEGPVFADMSKDEKLDEIKAKITLTTKKKGGAEDVREILGVFDAGRAGELDPKDYDDFYDALTRYRAGESVDDIFPEVD